MVQPNRRAAPKCYAQFTIELEAPAMLSLNCEVDTE